MENYAGFDNEHLFKVAEIYKFHLYCICFNDSGVDIMLVGQ